VAEAMVGTGRRADVGGRAAMATATRVPRAASGDVVQLTIEPPSTWHGNPAPLGSLAESPSARRWNQKKCRGKSLLGANFDA
jgi:hypothetical protein